MVKASYDTGPGSAYAKQKKAFAKQKAINEAKKKASSSSSSSSSSKSSSSSSSSSSRSSNQKKTVEISTKTKYAVVTSEGKVYQTDNYEWARNLAKEKTASVVNTRSSNADINRVLSAYSQSVAKSEADMNTAKANILNKNANLIYETQGKDSEEFKQVVKEINELGTAPVISDREASRKIQATQEKQLETYAQKQNKKTTYYADDKINRQTRPLTEDEKKQLTRNDLGVSTAFTKKTENKYTATDYYESKPYKDAQKVGEVTFNEVKGYKGKELTKEENGTDRLPTGAIHRGNDIVDNPNSNRNQSKQKDMDMGKIPEGTFVSLGGGVVSRASQKNTKFEQGIIEGISKPIRGLYKEAEFVFTDINKDYRNPLVSSVNQNPIVRTKKLLEAKFKGQETKVKLLNKTYELEQERARKIIGDTDVQTALASQLIAPVVMLAPALNIPLGAVGMGTSTSKFIKGDSKQKGEATVEFVLSSLMLKSGIKSVNWKNVNLNSKVLLLDRTRGRVPVSKQVEALRTNLQNVNTGKSLATGKYTLTKQGTVRTNEYQQQFKVKSSTKETKFGALRGKVESKDILIEDTIGNKLSVREVSSKSNTNIKLKYILDKQAGKVAEVVTFKGKPISKTVSQVSPATGKTTIEIGDPRSLTVAEASTGKQIIRTSATKQNINIQTSQGKLTGAFTERQSQLARVSKNLRDLKLGADLNKGKYAFTKKTTKARVEFGDSKVLKDKVTYGDIRGKNIITQQKAQPRVKSTTVRDLGLEFQFTNQPKPTTPQIQISKKASVPIQTPSNVKRVSSGLQETVLTSDVVTVAKSETAKVPTKNIVSKLKSLEALSKISNYVKSNYNSKIIPLVSAQEVQPTLKAKVEPKVETQPKIKSVSIQEEDEEEKIIEDVRTAQSSSIDLDSTVVQEVSQKSNTEQKVTPDVKTNTEVVTEVKQSLIPTQKTSLNLSIETAQPKPFRINFPDITEMPRDISIKPKWNDFKPKKRKSPIDVYVKRKGRDVRIGTFNNEFTAKNYLRNRLKNTARASGFFKIGNQKKYADLGVGFRRSKVNPFRVVQKRSQRIKTAGEKRDITFKGLKLNKKIGRFFK
jgi:hypothetical protein